MRHPAVIGRRSASADVGIEAGGGDGLSLQLRLKAQADVLAARPEKKPKESNICRHSRDGKMLELVI